MSYSAETGPRRARRTLKLILRIALTGCVFAWLFMRADASTVLEATQRIPAAIILLSFASFTVGMTAGLVRWRLLFSAYGATPLPSWSELTRWYLISMFYNLLPGGVGGDVLRAYATRRYFPVGGTVRSMSVVFVERVLGLAGLLAPMALASIFSGLIDREVMVVSALGLVGAALACLASAKGYQLRRFLPRRLGAVFAALPERVAAQPFALAVALSVVPHILAAVSGQLLLLSLAPNVAWADAVVIFSLGTLAAFFPFTVAGAGARDTALVILLGRVGVMQADALACSLALLAFHLALAALGGLIQAPGEVSSDEPVDDAETLVGRESEQS